MKQYKVFLFVLVCGTLFTQSCEKGFLDVNTDPNNPTRVTPALLLPSAQVDLAYTNGGDLSRIAAGFTQHYSGHRNQPLRYDQYDIQFGDFDQMWANYYAGVLQDLKEMKVKAEAEGSNYYVGISKILSGYVYSILTDMFGDIPYTDALKVEAITAPAYD